MRLIILITILAAAYSCQGPSGERAVTGEAGTAEVTATGYEPFYADTENSNIEWIGARPASQHNGIITLKGGELQINNGEIAGGNFVIDLQNIVVLDITDPDRNARLREHLESDDFFDVPNYPEAVFEITGIQKTAGNDSDYTHQVTGNLTMRGVTRSVTFNSEIEVDDDTVTARSARFLIDRTEWGVNFQSPTIYANLVDRFILDDISLMINLTATRL